MIILKITYLSTYLPIYLPTYLFTYLSTYLPHKKVVKFKNIPENLKFFKNTKL